MTAVKSFDVAILGAGLAGRLCAWLLVPPVPAWRWSSVAAPTAPARPPTWPPPCWPPAGRVGHRGAAYRRSRHGQRRPVACLDQELPEPRVLPGRRHAGGLARAGPQRGVAVHGPHARRGAAGTGAGAAGRAGRRRRGCRGAGAGRALPAQGLLLKGEEPAGQAVARCALLDCAVKEGVCIWEAGDVDIDLLPSSTSAPTWCWTAAAWARATAWCDPTAEPGVVKPGLRGLRGEVVRVHAPDVKTASAHPPAASALPHLYRAQAERPVRDRRDRNRVRGRLADERALRAGAALGGALAAPAFGEARVLELNVQRLAHAAGPPAGDPRGSAGARGACEWLVPAWLAELRRP